MTRNTPEILPFCQHCGKFKGVGICYNPKCDKTNRISTETLGERSNDCVICSTEGEYSCTRCGASYCIQHTSGREESKLTEVDQRLGTCVICGKVICEQCWIFDNRGFVTCLIHRESNEDE